MSVEGIRRVLQAQGGAGTSRQVLAAGFSRRTMDLMVRRRELVRVRRDVVVLAEALADITPWERQTLLARAVGRSLAPAVPFAAPAISGGAGPATSGGADPAAASQAPVEAGPAPQRQPQPQSPPTPVEAGPAPQRQTQPQPPPTPVEAGPAPQPPATGVHALSHESALMLHGLPYYGEDGLIHLVRTDGRRGRRDNTVWVHSPVGEDWVVDVDGVRVLRPALAALQVAALHGVEAGLVALDGVLHEAQQRDRAEVGRRDGPATAEARREIEAALEVVGVSSTAVRQVVELADGRSESAGESRSRWLLHALGLGPCTPQLELRDGSELIARVDLRLDRWRIIIEFDGTGKYDRREDLIAEKDREDRIRALGYEVVRLRWADLDRPHLVRQRVLAAIARAEARDAATA